MDELEVMLKRLKADAERLKAEAASGRPWSVVDEMIAAQTATAIAAAERAKVATAAAARLVEQHAIGQRWLQ
jgi:hypothetical protein